MSIKTDKMLKKVSNTIEKYNMLECGDNILVAVSGGADSVCLLHILYKLSEVYKLKLYVAHLNHCIRGEEADDDEKYVMDLCKKLEINAFSKSVKVEEIAAEKKITVEEAGRIARYDFFKGLCNSEHINKIATAHNKNDQAETVLMRIMRGTGLDGLSGIQHIREDGVIRPILDIERADIEEYCKENKLDYHTDRTNSDNDYTRNRVRNELLPYIKDNFNPGIVEGLANMADNISSDAKFVNNYAQRLYERVNNPLPSKKPVVLHIDSIRMLDTSIKARLIRIAAKNTLKCNPELEKCHIEDILKLFDKETGTKIDLPHGLVVSVKYGWLEFLDKNEVKTVETGIENVFYVEVYPENIYEVPILNKTIEFKIVDPKSYKCEINEIMLDWNKLDGKQLILRNRRRGDKIALYKDGKSKKIKSLFIDMKIPQADRKKIPLLCVDDNNIAAVIGARVSEVYKVNKQTERALVIRYGSIRKV